MSELLAKLGFGGALLGNMFAAIDEAAADATLQTAWDSGARYLIPRPSMCARCASIALFGFSARGHATIS